ncbi:MAG: efflux RND transporter permease subunit [Halioglobus sp.]
MERLIGWWVNNPVAANLLMIGIVLSGFLGFQSMEREAFPTISPAQVQIEVVWPGAAPQEVEEQVIVRIEEALKNIDRVLHIYSTATENFGRIEVTTFPNVDINAFLNDVKSAVDSVTSLPRDIENPRIQRTEYRQEMLRIAVHGDVSERELTRLAEDLRDEVAALPYISTIELFGSRREEVTIELSEAALRRYKLSFSEVAAAIRSNSINLSSGQVRTDTGDVQLRARNLADTEQDFERIVVRQTPEGAVIRVGDVATVIDGFEENRILATMNGQPAVLIQVQSTDDMQVVKSSDAVKAWLEDAKLRMPEGIDLTLWFDTADIYTSRMDLISESSFLGLLLVFCILMLSLRPKVALWVTAGIGVAFMGSFALLPANDVSLNVISTFAFLLVLGIVVDDAIVVGESIHQHAHELGGGSAAAIKGAMSVSRPVIFAVLTTIIAFAPWLFVTGDAAQITRQLSIVISFALVASVVEAFFILPSHLRHLEHREELKGLALRQQRIEHSIIDFANNWYKPLLNWALKHRALTASLFVASFIVSLGLFSSGWVKFYFTPQVERDDIYIQVELPTGTPYARALQVLDQLQRAEEQLIEQFDQEAAESGETSAQLVQGWYTRVRRDNVIAIVKLYPPEERDMSAREAADRLRKLVGEIPDADSIEVNYSLTDGGSDATFLLRHRDLDMLQSASKELQAHLRSFSSTFYVRDSQRGDLDELLINMKPGAEKLGISLSDVSAQIRQAYFGEEVQRLPRANGDVKVMVKYPMELRSNLASLDNFRVRTADGREVPLFSVVDIEIGAGVQRIQRRDGERVVYVRADMEKDSIGDITKDINDNFLPQLAERYPGLKILKGGQQEDEEQFMTEIISLYAIALFMMYALIAVAFHSYWLPLLIMTAIPFGFMGAIFGHLIFDLPMALFSYFGIGAAAGVVVNDNLVLVDYIRRMRDQGYDIIDAVLRAATNRFRPILLTTVTTFVGLIPIMSERSTSAEFLKPAVLSLAFGVLFALFVSLLMVPALYVIGDDCAKALTRLKARLFPKSNASKHAAP